MNPQIRYLPLQNLSVSQLNVRKQGASQQIETLAASIKAQGVLVPLIVRLLNDNGDGERYEIVAGQRRFLACERLAQDGINDPLPCLVIEPGDDAKALDISLAENATQLPMEPMEQFEAFAKLIKQGIGIGEIAARYGVTERTVQQRLALAKLIPDLKQEIRKNEISVQDVQSLTMATPAQQREWLKLYRKQRWSAPSGRPLRDWLCGGANIETSVALFPLENYQGPLLTDLFGDKTYFGDSAAFWTLQNAAIAEKQKSFEKAGWAKVVIWETNKYFSQWDYEVLTKAQNGWVFLIPKTTGEVEILKGLIPKQVLKQAQAAAQKVGAEAIKDFITAPEEPTKARRSELTAALTGYINLHKQAAVRQHLTQQPGLALRVAVAALMGGVETWSVRPDTCGATGDIFRSSVQPSMAQQTYERQHHDITAQVLGADDPDDDPLWVSRQQGEPAMADTLARLLERSDEEVLQLLAVLTAETLPAGSGLVEALGRYMAIDLRQSWRLDETFLKLLIDKEALTKMVKELDMPTGKNPKCTELRATLQRRINGEGCKPVEDWLPSYLEFPPHGYTDRFNAPTVRGYESMADALGLPASVETTRTVEPPAAKELGSEPDIEANSEADDLIEAA